MSVENLTPEENNPIASRVERTIAALDQARERTELSKLSAEAGAALGKMGQELGAVAKLDEKLETITRYAEEHAESDTVLPLRIYGVLREMNGYFKYPDSTADHKVFYADMVTKIDDILEKIHQKSQESGGS